MVIGYVIMVVIDRSRLLNSIRISLNTSTQQRKLSSLNPQNPLPLVLTKNYATIQFLSARLVVTIFFNWDQLVAGRTL